MQQIADRDNASGLSGKISRKCGRAAGERTHHRIQFPTPVRQIHVSNAKSAPLNIATVENRKRFFPSQKLCWLGASGRYDSELTMGSAAASL